MTYATGASQGHVHRDDTASKLGMYLFLFTEILLFGGLFLLYAIYRFKFASEFHEAGHHLNFVLGVANTAVLLTSSLTMALSIASIQRGNRRLALLFLAATILLGAAFMVNKYFEWSGEIHHGLYPGSPGLAALGKGGTLFFGLYFTMTGLHGVHVLAGMAVLSVMFAFLARGSIHSGNFIRLENSGLYWHLVDIIWIFLLPLFYLAT